MIDSQPEFDALVQRLANATEIAIDCEMDSMFSYRTSLCVVQVGDGEREDLIDASSGLDTSGLSAIFANPEVCKVFHGGENDIGLLRAQWGSDFATIFDTMAGAQVLGHDGVGLAASLKRHFDVHVSKKFQKADWRVRPLPVEQAEYARMDVRYLLELRDILLDELEELGRVEEAESEFERIRQAHHEHKDFDPESWGRCKSVKKLDPTHRGAFRELFVARDAIACDRNWAPYRVMQESTLQDLAKRAPKSVSDLRDVRGVSRRLNESELTAIVDAIMRGREAGEVKVPKNKRGWSPAQAAGGPMTPEQQATFDALRGWRTERAKKRGVDVARVATNALLASIVRAHPTSREGLAAVEGMEAWRMREYGDELTEVLRATPTQSP